MLLCLRFDHYLSAHLSQITNDAYLLREAGRPHFLGHPEAHDPAPTFGGVSTSAVNGHCLDIAEGSERHDHIVKLKGKQVAKF